MSEDKKKETSRTINLLELETDLQLKEQMLKQVEAAHQQLIGQINCLKELIKKVKMPTYCKECDKEISKGENINQC